MKKLSNKGFAASVVLYGASTIIILVLLLILSILSTGEKNVSGMADTIKMEASGVKGTTYQLRNMIVNGGFEDGVYSWKKYMIPIEDSIHGKIDSTNSKSGSKSILIDPNGWQYQRLTGAISTNDKLYFSAHINIKEVNSEGLSIGLTYNSKKEENTSWGVPIEILEGKYYYNTLTTEFSKIGAIGKVGDDMEVFVQLGAGSTADINANVDNIVVINLTKTFGAGNEPDLAWCNANIEYFEGTTSITVYENE